MAAEVWREKVNTLLHFPGIPPGQAHAFAAMLLSPAPAQLACANPFLFSEERNLDPGPTLDCFLCAVQAGIFNMTWNLFCPVCGTPEKTADSIARIPESFFCAHCRKEMLAALDDSIEILFAIHPDLAQESIESDISPQDTARTSSRRRSFLDGKTLLNNQTFRSLFPRHELPADFRIPLRSLTSLAARIETSAPLLDHPSKTSECLRLCIPIFRESSRKHSGALVRQGNDGFLAAFSEPRDGVLAALDIMDAFHEKQQTAHGQLRLRIGLDEAPAFAVNKNQGLDYAGKSVAGAEQACDLAEPDEIALTESVFYAPDAREILEFLGYGAEERGASRETDEPPRRLYACKAGRSWKNYPERNRRPACP